MRSLTLSTGALLTALVLAGCAALTRPAAPLRVVEQPRVSANPNPAVPLAAVVSFDVNRPVSTTIEINEGAHRWSLHFDDTRAPAKGLPVVGMRPGRRHILRVTVRDRSGATQTLRPLGYTTPALPTDPAEFPKIHVKAHLPAKVEPGLTLFNPRRRIPGAASRRFNQGFGMLVAVDERGEVVWYYRGDSRISDFAQLRNGNLVFITQDNRLVEIDLLGNIKRQWVARGRPEGPGDGTPVDTLTFHHSVKELPNGNVLILGTERRQVEAYFTSAWDSAAPRRTQWVMGDEIVEFRKSDGRVVWRWKAFDHLDPMRIGYQTFSGYWERRGWPGTVDWTHANNVSFVGRDNAVLCNLRYQSAILKIDRETGNIIWIAGEHSGWPKTLQGRLLKLEGTDKWFWHQHAPELTAKGTLLLFDNDNFRARPFDEPAPPSAVRSRAAEYRIDERGRTIHRVWTSEIPGEGPLASWAMGSARALPKTGNVLVGYGLMFLPEDLKAATWQTRLQFKGRTMIREFTHTTPAEVVWELTLTSQDPTSKIGWSLFGARRLPRLTQ